MKTLLVKTGTPYEIKIERGLLRRAGDEIRRIPELRGARKAAVVTDSNLATQAQAVKALSLIHISLRFFVFDKPLKSIIVIGIQFHELSFV